MILSKEPLFGQLHNKYEGPAFINGKKVLTGVQVTPTGIFRVDFTDDLETLYQLVDCDTIDIITRRVGGKPFDIVIDDNGRIDGKPSSALALDVEEDLRGNLLLVGLADYEGNLTSLSLYDLGLIGGAFGINPFSSKNGFPYWLAYSVFED